MEPELRQELLAAFESEYRDHLIAIRAVLDGDAVAGAALRDVFRRAHSLKGASRAVELPGIEEIAHGLETLLYRSVEQDRPLPAEDIVLVRRGLDSIEAGMQAGMQGAGSALAVPASGPGEAGSDEPGGAGAQDQPANETAPHDPGATSRVSARDIDRLVESLQAASDAMAGQEQGREWLIAHRDALERVLALCARPSHATQAGPDASDASGGSGASDEVARGLRDLIRSATTRLRDGLREDWQRDQAVATLRSQIQTVALISAESVFGALGAMARDLARAQGQEIVVTLEGMGLRAERSVLQALRDPVIQLLRNAVGHGLRGRAPIEAGAAATAAGQPEIVLSVVSRGGALSVSVADDGAGPDLPAIERTARRRGLLPPGAATPDEAGLLSLVFEPGFSTATEVDRLSGRGMGLSIVAEAAARLEGTARMQVRRGPDGQANGTILTVSVPVGARRQALLLLEAGGHLLGLPCDSVTRLLSVPRARIERTEQGWAARVEGSARLPLRSLAGLLGAPEPDPGGPVVIVVMRGVGLVVERLCAVRTLVVRRPSIVGVDLALVGGVALTGRGSPVLVLEPDGLLRSGPAAPAASEARPARERATGEPGRAVAVARRQPTILVVDDSITTRTLEKTILQAQGYRVLIAVDGMEALGLLRTAEQEIDVVVADVEMPRMDGFGLLAAMRADPRLDSIPAILMTSRDRDDDVRRGLELGARAYLTKQDFEQGALLAVIRQVLP
jgi:two-component system chemotaxis sensor kinase CheA